MVNRTDGFLAGLDELASRPLPEAVSRQASMSVVDYLACAHLGRHLLEEENGVLLGSMEGESGRSAVIGTGVLKSAHAAALLNGINAHVAELDDGHRYAMVHGGATVISALLAMAGRDRMSGARFLHGVVMGYEAAIRLASAIQPGHKFKGFHATGTCGAVGAAMGIAYALDFEPEQKKSALSAALTGASGLLEMIDDASMFKPYNAGRAAASGVDAAMVGRAGFSGPFDALGGKRGFLQMAAQDVDEELLFGGRGGSYAIEGIYRKPYAACRHCHAAIEAALVAARDNGVAPQDVESVEVETYGLAVGGHDHVSIAGTSSAKMSIPYSVAAALRFGSADFQQFEQECLEDELVQQLTRKVSVAESPELSALAPAKRAAIVRIRTADDTFSARVDYPKGEPENPITPEELECKFMSLMTASGRNGASARELLECAWQVEERFSDLLDMLR